MIQNLCTCYQIKKNKQKGDGKVPIYLRVTLDGERFENSTHRYIDPNSWDQSQQKVKGRSEAAKVVNNYLSELNTSVLRHYNQLLNDNIRVTIDDLKNSFKPDRANQISILHVFEENNELIKLEEGEKYAKSTVSQYNTTFERLKNFIIKKYGVNDILLDSIDLNFIRRFEIYLRTEHNTGGNTAMKYLKQLKKVIHYVMELGYLDKDPFYNYKTAFKETNRGFLTPDELIRIEEKKFRIERLDRVRDVFVFVCYTGLSYSDLKNLTPASITKGIDGKNWIIYLREKTGIRASIPILPPAQAIIDKYKNDPECNACNKLLPIKSNQKLNSYLSEIAELCEVDKHVTMHLGRHTFATTVTLTNGVPIETVQKMLGHKNLSTTQICHFFNDEMLMTELCCWARLQKNSK
jgi:site-specific recombinase XerD